jgi:murein DD-endopeptidase MepM/ murein hydrolase activator NlpD
MVGMEAAAWPLRRRAAVAVACLALLATGPPAVAAEDPGVERDAGVVSARQRADAEQARLGALERNLDRAAAAYEEAAARHLRLVEELEGADDRLAGAEADIAVAEDTLAGRMLELYRRPYETVAVADALVSGDDVAETLHGAALLEHAASRGADRLAQARAQGELTVDGVRQHRIVAAGVQAAAADRQEAAEVLGREVAQVRDRLAAAHDAVEAARAEAADRLEAERQAAAAAAAAWDPGTGSPLPPVDGRVCPIGGPNGFVDSWGYPRSGGRSHQGVDMFAAYGAPLYAVADGTIARVGTSALGGLALHLVDDAGDRYYYAHLSGVAVTEGQRVRAGEVVGGNGDSGNARGTPPHLHWEVHPGGGPPVNPYPLAVALCRPTSEPFALESP